MKILLINYEYPPVGGGAANATYEIARAMVKLGHAPVVLTARYRNRLADTANPGIKVIEVPALRRRVDRCSILEMTTFLASAAWRVRAILRRERIQGMIAFFSIPCGPIAWWGWRGTKIPYVVSLRGGDVPGNEPGIAWFHRLLRPLRHAVYCHAKGVTAVSEGLKMKSEQVDPFPLTIIPNGVDTDFWHPPEHRAGTPPFRLLFVGRFQSQKNLPWLFQQLAELAKASSLPPWEFHLVGDGPQREELEKLANQLRIDPLLHWHGWLQRDALRESYQSSHYLILPALYEGMSNVLYEALACGLSAIASESAVSSEMTRAHGRLLTFPGFQDHSFVSTMSEQLRQPKLAERHGAACASWSDTAQQFLARLA